MWYISMHSIMSDRVYTQVGVTTKIYVTTKEMAYYKSPLVNEKDVTFGCSQDVVDVIATQVTTQDLFASTDASSGTVIQDSTYKNGGLRYVAADDQSSDSIVFRIKGLPAFAVFTIHNVGTVNDQPIEFRSRRQADEYVLVIETPLVAGTAFEVIWAS